MYRRITLLAILIVLASMAGCRQCQSCLDYCGPLPEEPCDFMARKNSILYKGGQTSVDELISSEGGDFETGPGGEVVEPMPETETDGLPKTDAAPEVENEPAGDMDTEAPELETEAAPQLKPVPDPFTSGGWRPLRGRR
jgi:hypothetical protein